MVQQQQKISNVGQCILEDDARKKQCQFEHNGPIKEKRSKLDSPRNSDYNIEYTANLRFGSAPRHKFDVECNCVSALLSYCVLYCAV